MRLVNNYVQPDMLLAFFMFKTEFSFGFLGKMSIMKTPVVLTSIFCKNKFNQIQTTSKFGI